MDNRKKRTPLFVSVFVVGIMGCALYFLLKSDSSFKIQSDNASYQSRLVHSQALNPPADSMTIQYVYEANTVILGFSPSLPAPVGKVLFLHPSNRQKDRIFELKTNLSRLMFIPMDGFDTGNWRLVVEWQRDTTRYRKEENIYLQANNWSRPVH